MLCSMKMVAWTKGNRTRTGRDEDVEVQRLGDTVREAILRWFGHAQRTDSEFIGKRMLKIQLSRKRQKRKVKVEIHAYSKRENGTNWIEERKRRCHREVQKDDLL